MIAMPGVLFSRRILKGGATPWREESKKPAISWHTTLLTFYSSYLILGVWMVNMKIYDSELKILNVLWQEGDTTAKHISDTLKKETGWNINTTYTLIKRCIEKGFIKRSESCFICHALIAKEDVQKTETYLLVDRLFNGSVANLLALLLGKKSISASQYDRLKQIVEEWK